MPIYHGNGLDELACFVLPLVILGVTLLVVMRRNPQFEDEETTEVDDEAPEVDDPDPPADQSL